MCVKEMVMINVGDVFINTQHPKMLRVLSYTGEGFEQECYCIVEYKGECWNESNTAYFIEKYYTKLESYNE